MLPYDDKDEFQVVVDMPEGMPLERTDAVLREMSAYLTDQPVVTDVQTYAGDAAPANLNGLVRHYDLRSAPHQGDVARQVKTVFEETEGVVDVDWRVEADQTKYRFHVNNEKAMRAGVSTACIAKTTRMALGGQDVTQMHLPRSAIRWAFTCGSGRKTAPASRT